MDKDGLTQLISSCEVKLPEEELTMLLSSAMVGNCIGELHNCRGWTVSGLQGGQEYLLLEDDGEQLHAIPVRGQGDVDFWTRLLGSDGALIPPSDPSAPPTMGRPPVVTWAHVEGGEVQDLEAESEEATRARAARAAFRRITLSAEERRT